MDDESLDRLGLKNAAVMDQQELPMSSSPNTATNEQEKKQTDELIKEKVTVRRNTYDEEDCNYMLRILEKDAFSTVVSAFRAQGMLNDYKRILLEHLKTALFISDESYHAEIRQAANDEVLSKIAQTLSPSYDTYAQWGIESLDPIPHYDDIPIQENIADDDNVDQNIANELLKLAKVHNAKLHDANTALHEMIALPKAPYVPERLRLLLRETENDYKGRIDLLVSGEDGDDTRTCRVTSSLIKSEPFDETQQFTRMTQSAEKLYVNDSSQKTTTYYDVTPSTSTARPSSLELATSCPSSSSSSTPVISSDQAILISKCNVQADEDFDSLAGEYVRPKKRRRDLSATCARVLPFRFQSPAPGQKSKPIRGNPDRRPPRQASPSGISSFTSTSSLSNSPSVISSLPSHTTALPAFRTISTNSNTISSGRFHQVPHLFTSGVVIKRTRTLSSGGNEPAVLDNNSTIPRQLSNAQNVFRIQQPVQRSYIRSSSGQRFYASPIVSAYSNPTRPYYGNPNTLVGFMRSVSSNSPRSSYTISSGPSTSSTCHLQPQTITSGEIQRLVAQAAASGQPQQYRTIRRPPPRPVVLTNSSRFSITNQRQELPVSVAPFISLSETGANSCSLQQQQLALHPALRVTHRTLPSSLTVTSATQRLHTVSSTRFDDNTSLAANMKLQHNSSGNLELQQSDLDTIAAVNSITQDNDEKMQHKHGTDMNESVVAVNPNETSSQVRVGCDEVLLPESRCILSNYDNNTANVQVTQLQQPVSEEVPVIVSYRAENQDGNRNRTSHLMPEEYANGLIHQDGQNIINYVTAPQCIQ
ncbi:ENT domain protein [Onchocerca flexuosa]|uniref:ENT domain protein n=1 Tax=Onchocerca flexuosa TaxID=387005 RepID=A0A238BVC2_9BILA|nr:ENT domain protein [Onchocerca flexuosa]